MYGMIHKAAREFSTERLGPEAWVKLQDRAGLNSEHFISGQHYGDDVTVKLLGEIAGELGCGLEDLLREFGRYWICFTSKSDYASVMDMAGDDLVTFLQNLDALHSSIKATMPEASLPSFQVLSHDETAIELVYRSEREGLTVFVQGLLEGLMQRFSEEGTVSASVDDDGIVFRISKHQSKAA